MEIGYVQVEMEKSMNYSYYAEIVQMCRMLRLPINW